MSEQWSTGLCDCWCDASLCCYITWCGPCAAAQVVSLLNTGDPGGFIGDSNAFLIFFLLGWVGLNYVIPCMTCSTRTKIRARYNLIDAPCSDCCVHWWCWSCAIGQEWTELMIRNGKRQRPQKGATVAPVTEEMVR
eukprot:c11670_g1_i1.p2 GENE.c11670_g1_i1~~c11670_g1_i1.p2  ORF type:complete len:147 (-),score=29.26 c11670_g1_i1:53-460(-)